MLIALNTESTKYFTEDTEKIIKNHHHHNLSVAHCDFNAVGNQGERPTTNGERLTANGESLVSSRRTRSTDPVSGGIVFRDHADLWQWNLPASE